MTAPSPDVRWKQRLASLEKALARLDEGAAIAAPTPIELQGTIKAFELSFELAWNVLKDYLRAQGIEDVVGPRDAIRRSGSLGLLDDPELWFEMMQARNLSSHVYDDSHAAALFRDIGLRYRGRLRRFATEIAARGAT
jgi:nucleotidyltransferase substrate binding protein (TIGR01987 family)